VRYALWGHVTRDILTHQGRPIVHDNRAELEFLFPHSRVVPVTDADLAARSPLAPLPLPEHPDMAPVRFPLRKEDFR
jgi:hypothetical protein